MMTYKLGVVEDDKDILFLITMSMDQWDCSVLFQWSDPVKAMSSYEPWRQVDVAILDYMMPVYDGYDVAEWLKKELPELPVIIITAVPELALEDSRSYLAEEVIGKMSEAEDLAMLVRNLASSITHAKDDK